MHYRGVASAAAAEKQKTKNEKQESAQSHPRNPTLNWDYPLGSKADHGRPHARRKGINTAKKEALVVRVYHKRIVPTNLLH